MESGPATSLTMTFDTVQGGMPGGSVKAPKDAVPLESLSFASENPVNIGSATRGSGAGKLKFIGFTLTKRLDASSVPPFQVLTRGAHFKQVDIVVRREGSKGSEKPTAEYKMATVFLTHIKTHSHGQVPTETITGLFGALQFEVTSQNPNGSPGKTTTGSWSQLTNSPATEIKGRRH